MGAVLIPIIISGISILCSMCVCYRASNKEREYRTKIRLYNAREGRYARLCEQQILEHQIERDALHNEIRRLMMLCNKYRKEAG